MPLYLNDIIIFSSTLEEHCQQLVRVLVKLENAPGQFGEMYACSGSGALLGSYCVGRGRHSESKQVEAVARYPVPRAGRELKSFLGLAGVLPTFCEWVCRPSQTTNHNLLHKEMKLLVTKVNGSLALPSRRPSVR